MPALAGRPSGVLVLRHGDDDVTRMRLQAQMGRIGVLGICLGHGGGGRARTGSAQHQAHGVERRRADQRQIVRSGAKPQSLARGPTDSGGHLAIRQDLGVRGTDRGRVRVAPNAQGRPAPTRALDLLRGGDDREIGNTRQPELTDADTDLTALSLEVEAADRLCLVDPDLQAVGGDGREARAPLGVQLHLALHPRRDQADLGRQPRRYVIGARDGDPADPPRGQPAQLQRRPGVGGVGDPGGPGVVVHRGQGRGTRVGHCRRRGGDPDRLVAEQQIGERPTGPGPYPDGGDVGTRRAQREGSGRAVGSSLARC